MEFIYILLILGAAFLEISDKCNTRNLLKKLGLTLVMLGAMLALAHRPNIMVEFGMCCYFIAELAQSYFTKRQRRHYDKVANS